MIVTEKYIEKFLRTNGIQDEYHVIHFCRELKINHYFNLEITSECAWGYFNKFSVLVTSRVINNKENDF